MDSKVTTKWDITTSKIRWQSSSGRWNGPRERYGR